MVILGINAYHADSSAAIFRDGVMIVATEEERFRRIKHWAGFPAQAIEFCLKEAGVNLNEVDHISIGRDPKAKIWNKAKYVLKGLTKKNTLLFDRLKNSEKVKSLELEFAEHFGIESSIIKKKIIGYGRF